MCVNVCKCVCARACVCVDACIDVCMGACMYVCVYSCISVDGKKEFALGPGRVPVLVDSFGTLDEDRWWDAEEYAKGNIVQLSKEFVRQHYVRTGHQEELRLARDSGATDPPIPALPDEVINETAALYASMYERLTGRDF